MSGIRRVQLLNARMNALFTHDDTGRIDRINEPHGAHAPRFYFGKTVAGNIWRFHRDLPDKLVDELTALCLAEPDDGDVSQRPLNAGAFVQSLDRHSGVQKIWTGAAFLFPDVLDRPEDTVLITEDTVNLVTPGFDDWVPDVATGQPFLAAVAENRAVSVCCSVRVTPDVHEAGVETLPTMRRAGHGTRAVSAWAVAVRALGAVPMYSTSWENAASLGVANKLGLELFGLDFHVT